MGPRLRVLLTNDDGYDSPALQALAVRLREFADVQIVAPLNNNSGASSALSPVPEITISMLDTHTAAVHGTPVDCVKLALLTEGVIPWQPNLTVSGVNLGDNLGEATVHSGTIGAAAESTKYGVPGIAFSLASEKHPPVHIADSAAIAAELVHKLQDKLLAHPQILTSINIPDLPYDEIKEPVVCALGHRYGRFAPNARILGTAHQPRGIERSCLMPDEDIRAAATQTYSDFAAVLNGHVSITPLQFNLTHKNKMELVQAWLE